MDSTTAPLIADSTPYVVVDTQTGLVVMRATYKSRNRVRAYADRKDIAYGAVRYVCRVELTR